MFQLIDVIKTVVILAVAAVSPSPAHSQQVSQSSYSQVAPGNAGRDIPPARHIAPGNAGRDADVTTTSK